VTCIEDAPLLLALAQDHKEIVQRHLARKHRPRIGLKRSLRLDAADRHRKEGKQEEGDYQQVCQVRERAGDG
jgi:hypothetical protein